MVVPYLTCESHEAVVALAVRCQLRCQFFPATVDSRYGGGKMDWINIAALAVALIALAMSAHFWRRQFRPLVTAMVKTHRGTWSSRTTSTIPGPSSEEEPGRDQRDRAFSF